jgi:ubiquinone/menaquinone biosynthesis C-methylase UbiE
MNQPLNASAEVFQTRAQAYDDWFDSEKGQALFELERQCLEQLKSGLQGTWLEVGVGSGRFAQALGVKHGIDPAPALLEQAQARGIQTTLGYGEQLPYADASFDGVLLVCTICFVQSPEEVLAQCQRVLKPQGHVLIGFVPSDSAWAAHYREKAEAGHPFWASARFYSEAQLISMANQAGLDLVQSSRCCLPNPPQQQDRLAQSEQAPWPSTGFHGLLFKRRD